MVWWRISWKEFRSRPLRTFLTLSSIIIGVGAVVAVALAIDNTRSSQKAMMQAVAGNASLEVQSIVGSPFDQDVLKEIRSVGDVQVATGVIRRGANMFVHEKDRVSVQVLGIDPSVDDSIREYTIKEGRSIQDSDEILIDANFGRSLDLKVDSKVKFTTGYGPQPATVVGLVSPKSGSSVLQGGIVMAPIGSAQTWFRYGKRLDAIQIVLADNANVDKVQESIEKILPQGLAVRKPSLRNDIGKEAVLATEQGLRLASAFSLMIAIFIIYNTFQMNVGERRRQLGIMRAIGATGKEIQTMIVREGVLLGIVGTIVGWIVGYVGTSYLALANNSLLDIKVASQNFEWFPFALAGVCGVGVSIFGAYFPAKRAARLSPSEAMRVVAAGELEPSNRLLAYTGSLLSVVGFTILMLCVYNVIHIDYAIPGTVLFLLGGIVILPTVLEGATDLVLKFVGRWLGIEGRLAQRQLLRHRGRSSLTIGIVFIALSTGLGLACTILDNIRNVRQWSDRAFPADLFVQSTSPSLMAGKAAMIPMDLYNEISKIPGIKNSEPIRAVNARAGDATFLVIARLFENVDSKLFDLVSGNPDTIFDRLRSGDVVIGSVLAERNKWKVGDVIKLDTSDGNADLKIVGVANDYTAAGLTVYMVRDQAERLLKIEGADSILISTEDGKLNEVSKEVRKITDREGLVFFTFDEIIQFIRAKVDSVVSGLWAVLGLGSIVAAFGLVNTLTMNILEQTSEIGMLRVVAMTRQQVRKMVLSQAILMGFIGLVPAVFAGLMIAYLLSLSAVPTTGYHVAFGFRPWLTILSFLGEFGIVILASLIPAERAARIKVAEALHYQ